MRNEKIPKDKATISMFLKHISCDFNLYIKMYVHLEILQRAETLSFFSFSSCNRILQFVFSCQGCMVKSPKNFHILFAQER